MKVTHTVEIYGLIRYGGTGVTEIRAKGQAVENLIINVRDNPVLNLGDEITVTVES